MGNTLTTAKSARKLSVLVHSLSKVYIFINFQKVVHIHDPSTTESRRVILRDSWRQATNVSPGQILNVIGSFDKLGNCIIDNGHNYVVLDPDYLVSATTVADTIGCMRKAVLQERIRASGDISKPMVYGNILHSLFQTALEVNDFSTAALTAYTSSILAEHIQSLFILREDIPDATEYVHSKFDLIQDWAKRFVGAKPRVWTSYSVPLPWLICTGRRCCY